MPGVPMLHLRNFETVERRLVEIPITSVVDFIVERGQTLQATQSMNGKGCGRPGMWCGKWESSGTYLGFAQGRGDV